MVYRVFATSLCTRTSTSVLPVQQLPMMGPLLYTPSWPTYSEPACTWLDPAFERRTGPRSTSHWGYPGQSEPKSWMRISHRIGLVFAPMVVHGAVFGSATPAALLVTCMDCCVPKAGITPRTSNNIRNRIIFEFSNLWYRYRTNDSHCRYIGANSRTLVADRFDYAHRRTPGRAVVVAVHVVVTPCVRPSLLH